MRDLGLIVVACGVVAIIVGGLLALGWLNWFGRLPGDIRIVSESTRVYIPLASMLVTSIALTVVVNVLRRLL